jgi:hypothetical protein
VEHPAGSGLLGFWLCFGSGTDRSGYAPSPKPRQKPKILASQRYIISVNALETGDIAKLLSTPKFLQEMKTEAARGCVICRCLRPLQLHDQITALPWLCL